MSEIENRLALEAIKEVADEMTEEQAWVFVRDLPDEFGVGDEWMAIYLAKKFPSIGQRLKSKDL